MKRADPEQLPYLIKLLDDDSDIVKQTVLDALSSYGSSLQRELERLNIVREPEKFRQLQGLLEEHNRAWLKKEWESWFSIEDDFQRLEAALSLLADFQNGRAYPVKLGVLLDQLAEDFTSSQPHNDARTLSNYLFKLKAFGGAHSDFYNPLNSNLVYVLEERRGIPISLVCVYILAGWRLGFDIRGINTPGHFLAKATIEGQPFLVDCFNGGRFLGASDVEALQPRSPLQLADILGMECDSEVIVARTLRNLHHAYKEAANLANANFMAELVEMMNFEDDEPSSGI